MAKSPIAPIERRFSISRRLFLGSSLAAAALSSTGRAEEERRSSPDATFAARQIPARELPVPTTVSPQLQAIIGAPLRTDWDVVPPTAAAWKDLASRVASGTAPTLAALKKHFGLQVEQTTMAGVPVFMITPKEIAPANRDRLLVHIHGGAFVFFSGEAGAGEGMMMAGYGKIRVVSIDYRTAPDFPFPAALDDVSAVWKSLLSAHEPARMGMFGTSAGGALTLSAVLRAKSQGLPLPGAIAPGSPCADLTWSSDTIRANDFVDNSLISIKGSLDAAISLYAAGHDLRDPELSPIYGDFGGFPPAILTSGTRDLLLSDTVRAHRKLRQAGVDAALQVFEGESHAQFLAPFIPETEEAFGEIAHFFDAHLAS